MLDRKFALEIIAKAIKDVDLRFYPKQEYEDFLYRQLKKYLGIEENYIAAGSELGSNNRSPPFNNRTRKTCYRINTHFSYFLNRCELHGLKLESSLCEGKIIPYAKVISSSLPNNLKLYIFAPQITPPVINLTKS